MPAFTIELNGHMVTRLNRIVGRYNADNGTGMTLQAWLQLHIREIAIQEDLAAEHAALTKQAEADVAAAVRAAKDRLLSEADMPDEGAMS
jgi:hypothetical protein